MDWTTIRETLKTTVEGIDGLTHLGAVEWADAAESGYVRQYPRVDLSIGSLVATGDDEQRIEVDGGGVPTEYISGPRRFTWTIRVEADRATTGEALTVIDHIRARLARNSVIDALAEENLSIADMATTQVLNFERDGRRYTVAVLDVFVNGVENDVDDSDEAGNYIRDASIVSEYLLDPDDGQNPNQVTIDVDT